MTAAGNAAVWKVIGEKGAGDDPSRLLVSCVPDLAAKPDLLDRVTPSCYLRILDTALDVTFGL